jgi:hypothetical protein
VFHFIAGFDEMPLAINDPAREVQSFRTDCMSDTEHKEVEAAPNSGGKKPFIEPEMKEFDDLEKQVGTPKIGPQSGF